MTQTICSLQLVAHIWLLTNCLQICLFNLLREICGSHSLLSYSRQLVTPLDIVGYEPLDNDRWISNLDSIQWIRIVHNYEMQIDLHALRSQPIIRL